jgi:hypothetical protein
MAGGTPAIRMAGKMPAFPEKGILPAGKNAGTGSLCYDVFLRTLA